MVIVKSGMLFLLLAFGVAACTRLPMIGGKPLPPLAQEGPPVYRDLADIPDAPPISTPESTDAAIKSVGSPGTELEFAL